MSHYADICAFDIGTYYDYYWQIMTLCKYVNKTSTSIEFLAILHYTWKRSNVGLGIKSAVELKTFVEEWNGHNTFVHPLKFDELLQ